MIKMIKHDIVFGFQQKITAFAFYILLAIVLMNFVTNVFDFRGSDLVDMYHPVKMLSISYNRVFYSADTTLLLTQWYPLLVVCPAGFILLSEKNRKENVLLITRIGFFKYYLSKIIAAFCITAIVFTVPFLIEYLLNCVSFPLAATGDFMGGNLYDPFYNEIVGNYIWPTFYRAHTYLYAIAGIFWFGLFSGILGALTVAITAIAPFKFKIFAFLPVYLLLNVTFLIPNEVMLELPFSVNWYDYILIFDEMPKNNILFAGILLVFIVFIIACIIQKSKGDQL